MSEITSKLAIFLDRDGTINEDIGYVSSPAELAIFPWTAEAVRVFNEAGLKVFVITNQSGIARGYYDEQMLSAIHDRLKEKLASAGARIDGIYYCPHHPEIGEGEYRLDCNCRKPRTGLLELAAAEHSIDLRASFVIGDKLSDLELASNAGASSVLVLTGEGRTWREIAEKSRYKPLLIAKNLLDAARQIVSKYGPFVTATDDGR